MTRYVAYANLADVPSGGEVNPDDFGGEGSDDFQYMLDRRTVVPMGDPDAPAPPEGEERPREWAEGQAGASVAGLGDLDADEVELVRAHRAKRIQAEADAAAKASSAQTGKAVVEDTGSTKASSQLGSSGSQGSAQSGLRSKAP